MMKNKRIAMVLICTMIAVLFGGCGKKTDAPAADPEKQTTQKIAATAETKLVYSKNDSLNPFEAKTSVNIRLMTLLYDGLFNLDSTYTPKEAVASGCAAGAETLNVNLKAGVKFSDGTSVTAQDVLYSFQLAKESPAYAERLRNFGTASSTSDSSIVFHLTAPDVFAQNCLTFPIIKKDSDGEYPIGTGRYCINNDGKLLLRKNQYHPNFTPNITCIALTEIKDPASVGSSLEIGNTCFIFDELTEGSYSRVNASTADVVLNNLVYLGFNGENEVLCSPEVRRAVNLAVNRKDIVTTAFQGHAKEAYTPFNPNWYYLSGTAKESVTEQMNVQELLAKSGMDLQNRTFTLLVNKDNAFKCETAALIAESLTAAGMQTTVKQRSFEDYRQLLQDGAFDLYLGEMRLSPDMDITDLFSGGSCDYGMTEDLQALSFERYSQLMAGKCELMDFVNTFSQEYPFVPLCYRCAVAGYTNSLQRDDTPCGDGDVYADIESWKIVKN